MGNLKGRSETRNKKPENRNQKIETRNTTVRLQLRLLSTFDFKLRLDYPDYTIFAISASETARFFVCAEDFVRTVILIFCPAYGILVAFSFQEIGLYSGRGR